MSRLKPFRDEMRATLVRVSAYVGGLAALSIFAAHVFDAAPVIAASEPAPRADWVEIERPHAAFTLTIPEAAEAPAGYAIRRHAAGGGRKDILSLGDAQGDAPYLRVEIYRPGRESVRFDDAGSEIAARAGELGPANAVHVQEPVDSKFGPLALVDFSTAGETPRHCLGFARSYDDPRLQISGWFCQGADKMIERAMLVCALDRLTLLSAGSEPKVAALFAKAELNRSFCGQRSTLMAATPKYRVLWAAIEQKQEKREDQKLRGRIAR
jgi:hypothetical protein